MHAVYLFTPKTERQYLPEGVKHKLPPPSRQPEYDPDKCREHHRMDSVLLKQPVF